MTTSKTPIIIYNDDLDEVRLLAQLTFKLVEPVERGKKGFKVWITVEKELPDTL